MKTEFVYLAHPIDFGGRGAHDYIADIALAMQDQQLAAYLPGYAFKLPLGAPPAPVVGRINRTALAECAGLIAFLPPVGQTSFGVPMEIEQARAEGKPVYIIGDQHQRDRSWALPFDEPFVRFSTGFGRREAAQLRAMIDARAKAPRLPASQALYVRMDNGAVPPSTSYEGDAGFDLYALEDTWVGVGKFVDVPMGCSVQLPDGVWGLLTGRSSTVRKLDLLVTTSIIDTGYRGPLFAGVRSLRSDDYLVAKGDRIAQLIPLPNLASNMHVTPVDVLSPSDRGEAGFGSSGA